MVNTKDWQNTISPPFESDLSKLLKKEYKYNSNEWNNSRDSEKKSFLLNSELKNFINSDRMSKAVDFTKNYKEDTPKTIPSKLSSKELKFDDAYKKAEQIDPSLKGKKNFYKQLAEVESSLRYYVLNESGAPYYGYFLMGEDNIRKTTGLSIDNFLKDPVKQILGASKLYKLFLKELKRIGTYEKGLDMGYFEEAMVAGAWLGGAGGVRTFINGEGDPSDNGGASVGKRMKLFNNGNLK